jgi:DNA-binding NarL/FixJ family response regulator
MTIRVLVADDQDIVRAGLTMILDAQPGIDVVGEAADGREAVALARKLRPDVCLFDIRMPQVDGIEATGQLAGPGVADPLAVVVITTFDLDEYVYGALKAGARGFLLKDAGPALLAQAIHAAAIGDALIAPSITARLLAGSIRQLPARISQSTAMPPMTRTLSPRATRFVITSPSVTFRTPSRSVSSSTTRPSASAGPRTSRLTTPLSRVAS